MDRLEEMPETVAIVLVGGPHDGSEYLVRREILRSGSIRTSDVTPTAKPRVPAINEYRLRLLYGLPVPSREGRLIFDFVGSIY